MLDKPIPPEQQAKSEYSTTVTAEAHRSRKKTSQVLDLQRALYLRALNAKSENRDVAALVCAFERLERLLRSIRMAADPKPASLDEIAADKARKKRGGPAASNLVEMSGVDPSSEDGLLAASK